MATKTISDPPGTRFDHVKTFSLELLFFCSHPSHKHSSRVQTHDSLQAVIKRCLLSHRHHHHIFAQASPILPFPSDHRHLTVSSFLRQEQRCADYQMLPSSLASSGYADNGTVQCHNFTGRFIHGSQGWCCGALCLRFYSFPSYYTAVFGVDSEGERERVCVCL